MTIRERIRELFLSPRPFYEPAEAARLLGWSAAEMTRAIADGELETIAGDNERIEWQEVAAMATMQHPQTLIEDALGSATADVMPELVRLAELRIRIPRYQALMLTRLADRDRTSVDDFLARQFDDLASSEHDWLTTHIAGFDAALRWPEL